MKQKRDQFVAAEMTFVLERALKGLGAEVVGMSLKVSENVTFDEWKKIGDHLSTLTNRSGVFFRFMLGDWYAALPKRYGARTAACDEVLGLGRTQQAKDANYVSKNFEEEYRDEYICWEFYRLLARVPKPARYRYLNECREKRWTTERLNEHLKIKFPSTRKSSGNNKESIVATTFEEEKSSDVTTFQDGDAALSVAGIRPLRAAYHKEPGVLVVVAKDGRGKVGTFNLSEDQLKKWGFVRANAAAIGDPSQEPSLASPQRPMPLLSDEDDETLDPFSDTLPEEMIESSVSEVITMEEPQTVEMKPPAPTMPDFVPPPPLPAEETLYPHTALQVGWEIHYIGDWLPITAIKGNHIELRGYSARLPRTIFERLGCKYRRPNRTAA